MERCNILYKRSMIHNLTLIQYVSNILALQISQQMCLHRRSRTDPSCRSDQPCLVVDTVPLSAQMLVSVLEEVLELVLEEVLEKVLEEVLEEVLVPSSAQELVSVLEETVCAHMVCNPFPRICNLHQYHNTPSQSNNSRSDHSLMILHSALRTSLPKGH